VVEKIHLHLISYGMLALKKNLGSCPKAIFQIQVKILKILQPTQRIAREEETLEDFKEVQVEYLLQDLLQELFHK